MNAAPLSETAIRQVNRSRHGFRSRITEACPSCAGESVIDRLAQVECGDCGVRTASYIGRLGEYQREMDAAANDWNAGRVKPA